MPATMPRSSSAPKPRVVTCSPVRPRIRLGRSGMSVAPQPGTYALHVREMAAIATVGPAPAAH
jgi:hypothetical protein